MEEKQGKTLDLTEMASSILDHSQEIMENNAKKTKKPSDFAAQTKQKLTEIQDNMKKTKQ